MESADRGWKLRSSLLPENWRKLAVETAAGLVDSSDGAPLKRLRKSEE